MFQSFISIENNEYKFDTLCYLLDTIKFIKAVINLKFKGYTL